MNADGSGKRRLAPAATGGPSWSPDGRWLAFAGPDCHGTLDVLKVPATMAGAPVSLLPTSPCAGKPAAVDGVGSTQPVGGTLAQRLKRESAVAWSPDGRRIAFRGGECASIFDDCLSVADVATGTEATLDGYGGGGQVYSGFGVLPAWHPGGDLVHSIVMHEHRPGFMGYRPKGERALHGLDQFILGGHLHLSFPSLLNPLTRRLAA
jgi:hypothetical protein